MTKKKPEQFIIDNFAVEQRMIEAKAIIDALALMLCDDDHILPNPFMVSAALDGASYLITAGIDSLSQPVQKTDLN